MKNTRAKNLDGDSGSEACSLGRWTRLLGPASQGPVNLPKAQMPNEPRTRYLQGD